MPSCLFFTLLVVLPLPLFISLFSFRCGGIRIVFDGGSSASPGMHQIPLDKNNPYQPQMAIAKIPVKRLIVLSNFRDEKLTYPKLSPFRFTGD